jgi:hypothetical protein
MAFSDACDEERRFIEADVALKSREAAGPLEEHDAEAVEAGVA